MFVLANELLHAFIWVFVHISKVLHLLFKLVLDCLLLGFPIELCDLYETEIEVIVNL